MTGTTSGIGKVTARELANRGATVVLVSHNRAKGEAAQAEIKQATSNQQVELLVADLSRLEEVRRLAAEFQQAYSHLHLLVNNAGCAYPTPTLTSDGLEATLAVNYLAPFLLTELLLDTLKASATARIVNVSSAQHANASIAFDNLQGEQKYTNLGSYNQAKLAVLLWTYELARRLEGTGVTVNALHPGGHCHEYCIGDERPARLGDEAGEVPPVDARARRSYDQAVGSHLWDVTEQMTARAEQWT